MKSVFPRLFEKPVPGFANVQPLTGMHSAQKDQLLKKKKSVADTEAELIALEQSEHAAKSTALPVAEPVEVAQVGIIPPSPGFPADEPVQSSISNLARFGGLGLASGIAMSTRGQVDNSALLSGTTFSANTPTTAFAREEALFADTVSITAHSIELSHVSAQYFNTAEVTENANSVTLTSGHIRVVDTMQIEPTGIYADTVSITATSESVASFIEVFANSGSITTATNIGVNDSVLVGNLVGQQQMLSINLGGGTADSVTLSGFNSSAIDVDKSTVVNGLVTLVLNDGATIEDTYVLTNVESFVFSDRTFNNADQLADFIANV